MKKEYTYTRTIEVEIDFDYLIKEYELENTNLEECQSAVRDYIAGFDDCEYYAIDNEDEIGQDLYDYIQSKK